MLRRQGPAPRRSRAPIALESLEGRVLLSTLPRTPIPPRAAEVASLRRPASPAPTATTGARWSWLEDTYWYVPAPNLSATIYDPGTGALIPVQDQTVYHISGYRSGYFWGETVAQLGQGEPNSSALVGSVTPQGRVLLTFTSTDSVIQGYGQMTRKHGQWTMENQMFAPTASGPQIGHWAYMVQTRPGQRSWRSLPSVGTSVPEFLSHYDLPGPTPVVTG